MCPVGAMHIYQMLRTKSYLTCKRIILAAIVVLGIIMYIYNFLDIIIESSYKIDHIEVGDNYLIQTEGCTIPNYGRTFHFKESWTFWKGDCGQRAVFIRKVSDHTIQFSIEDKHLKGNSDYQCCYQFLIRSTHKGKEDTELMNYLECQTFENGTTVPLHQELITVKCYRKKNKKNVIYKDSYMIVKKNNGTDDTNGVNKKWNILIVAMDTMSRVRVHDTMPETTNYIKQNRWLDFRAYHKVAYNTYPNLMAVLTGLTDVYKPSAKDHIIWKNFTSHGYRTAYGEDELDCPDTFRNYDGFPVQPTDHYMRPLFLTGETLLRNIVCTGKLSSGEQLLDYAFDFATTYNNTDPFFGLFWMNSFSHDISRKQTKIDRQVRDLFRKLNDSGVLENTFVMFLSDHGIRFGKQRSHIESFYDERLPMLFISVPRSFQQLYPAMYTNAAINQHRLVSTYDLHATLIEILRLSENKVVSDPVCKPHCVNIFTEHPPTRTCVDALISDKWCGCHVLKETNSSQDYVKQSIRTMEEFVKNHVAKIPTKGCEKCDSVGLKSVLRVHSYTKLNKTYFVIVIAVTKTNLHYEGLVSTDGKTYQVVGGVDAISAWTISGKCTIKYYHRGECKCIKDRECHKSKNKKH